MRTMRYIFEAWEDADESITLMRAERVEDAKVHGLIDPNGIMLYQIQADTWEEASAIHALRMGWSPYRPEGEPMSCPKCSAIYYPMGSGECWRCAHKE
jgi:hypothetical protein